MKGKNLVCIKGRWGEGRAMPELAEVELARRIWEPAIGEKVVSLKMESGARIFRDIPASALCVLEQKKMIGSMRHGKRMYFSFTGGIHLEVHLGMSGKAYRMPVGYEHQRHDHLILRMENCALVLNDYRMFGKVMIHDHEPWKHLPPDPLSEEFTSLYLQKLLEKRGELKVKSALLHQAYFPGVGNWMADEICWQMGVAPACKVKNLCLKKLHKHTRYVCDGAIKHITEENANHQKPMEDLGFKAGGYVSAVPPSSWLFQHRWKKGGVCPRCMNALARDTIAGRTTAWCFQCQPLPSSTL